MVNLKPAGIKAGFKREHEDEDEDPGLFLSLH